MCIKAGDTPRFRQCPGDAETHAENEPPMPREHLIDVCNLEPPEPFERVLQGLDLLADGDRLRVVIDRRPAPLFRVLERNGYAYREEPSARALLEIVIWKRD
jgi:uncharacterized protein (DUF2249 family)